MACGLIIIDVSADGMFRAFDEDAGEILGSMKIPFDANITPSVYSASGKEYVLISDGGTKTNRPRMGC